MIMRDNPLDLVPGGGRETERGGGGALVCVECRGVGGGGWGIH